MFHHTKHLAVARLRKAAFSLFTVSWYIENTLKFTDHLANHHFILHGWKCHLPIIHQQEYIPSSFLPQICFFHLPDHEKISLTSQSTLWLEKQNFIHLYIPTGTWCLVGIIYQSIYLSIHQFIYSSIHIPICQPLCPSIHLSINSPIHPSIQQIFLNILQVSAFFLGSVDIEKNKIDEGPALTSPTL